MLIKYINFQPQCVSCTDQSVCSHPCMCQETLCRVCKEIIPQCCYTSGELIWQLNWALVAYFSPVFITLCPLNFHRATEGNKIVKRDSFEHLAQSHLPADAVCWLDVPRKGVRVRGGGREKSQAVNIRSTCQTWLTSSSKAAREVTVIFWAGCGLVRETDTVVQSYRPFP